MIRLLSAHLVISLLLLILSVVLWNLSSAGSFIFGAVLAGGNLLVLVWVLGQIIRKKAFAFATGVIVLKYPLLALFVYIALQSDWVQVYPFALGVSTFFVDIAVMTVLRERLLIFK